MAQALDAKEREDFESALLSLDVLLSIEPTHKEAKKLQKEISVLFDEHQSYNEIKKFISVLEEETDIVALDEAVNEASALLGEGKGDNLLKEALKRGRARYDEKRMLQGAGTTASGWTIRYRQS